MFENRGTTVLTIPVEFETALLQQLLILKGKLLSGKSFLLYTPDWSANIPGPREDPTTSSGQCCSCLRPWETALTFKRIHFSSGLTFHTHLWGVSSLRGGLFRGCRPGDLGPEHEVGRVRVLCSAISTSVVKSWNHVFNLLCLGNLKRDEKITKITSGLKLMIVTLFHPRAKRNVHISSLFPNLACRVPLEVGRMASRLFCIVYPKANSEKKEYFTERMGFWKNEVSL